MKILKLHHYETSGLWMFSTNFQQYLSYIVVVLFVEQDINIDLFNNHNITLLNSERKHLRLIEK